MAKLSPAIAYLRVSGVSQMEGDGFRRQEDKIRSWAKRSCYEIVAVFREEGISGASELSERPALSELMLKIAGNGIRTVLVENATRFALSLIHISEPTRQAEISYADFCLKKKKKYI